MLEEGGAACAGWLRVPANGVISWARELYVVQAVD